jgi:putative ABC transport system substrate-binding protein
VKKSTAVFGMILCIISFADPASAQQATKMSRIGFLTAGAPVKTFKVRLAALRQGLRELGYVEGKNIVIEERYAKGDRENLPKLAAELVRLKSDIIVTHGGTVARIMDTAARKAGMTIPIVFAVSADPIGDGAVASLAYPGGNITGLSDLHSDLVAKRLELLKQLVPSASRIAVFWSPGALHTGRQLKTLQAVAPALGVSLLPIKFAKSSVESAFDVLRRERPDALNVLGYARIARYRQAIADFALKNRLPTISTSERSAMSGFLISYGVKFPDMYRRAATFVHKILKGAKPADLPVEQPTRFYLSVNLKTAKSLGITVPQSILLRAGRVIE